MRLAVLVLVLAAILAGCNVGPAGTPSTTPTATATATPPATGTVPPDPADVGLAADGVVDPFALGDAHAARLSEQSYTIGRSLTVRDGNGTVLVRDRTVVRVAENSDLFVWNESLEVAEGAPAWVPMGVRESGTVRAYSNTTTTTAVSVSGGTRNVARYDERSATTPFLGTRRSLSGRDLVVGTFRRVDTRVTGVERVDGTVRYQLVATDGPHDFGRERSTDLEFEVLSLSASVDRSGVVHRLAVRYAVTNGSERVTVRRVLSVTDLGATTVERPRWVDALDRNASAVRPGRTTP